METAYQLLDRTTRSEAARTRRKALLSILYHERYLTRKGLSSRLEMALGRTPSWFVFIQDMWFVRKAFRAIGYKLTCSWAGERRGFYLRGEGEVSPEVLKVIQGAIAKVDSRQVEITCQLTPAQRVQQGCSITDLAHSVVGYRKELNKRNLNEKRRG